MRNILRYLAKLILLTKYFQLFNFKSFEIIPRKMKIVIFFKKSNIPATTTV